ncbi:DNA/RNA non-specific endonuclease, partial [Xanthovirga aplysinae]|uniref:DNA/RNA non-specific endonuclease n=1 Tax=Xanthovirga aplysinae TaxID=2529853 RepID=UPI0012BC9DD6
PQPLADNYYFTRSFDFAWPEYQSTDNIVEHSYYTLNYEEAYEQASWVAYKLTEDHLEPNYKRTDNFRADPLIHTNSADRSDYKRSGYDRGHLAPAADFSWDATAMSESFLMSNMSPQSPEFNRGIWKKLEEKTRTWAKRNDELYVVTGPVLRKGLKKIGKNKVAVPKYYYKVILDIREPEIKAIGFLMENKGSEKDLKSFAIPIDKIEKISKLDFFPLLPDSLEQALESKVRLKGWF